MQQNNEATRFYIKSIVSNFSKKTLKYDTILENNIIQEYIKKYPRVFEDISMFNISYIINIPLKERITFKKTEMISVPLKVYTDSDSVLFGFIYYYAGCHGESIPIKEYICLGPTYDSADGEYRNNFITYNTYLLLFNYEKFNDLINFIKEDLIKNITLSYDIIIPFYNNDKNNNKIIKVIKSELKNNIENYYTYCYLNYFYKYKSKLLSNHINKNFNKCIYNNKSVEDKLLKKHDLEYYNKSIRSMNITKYENIIEYLLNKSYGQKITPITFGELKKKNDIEENIWREIFIKTKINNLLYNGILNNIPYFLGYFYINSSNKNIYDNDVTYLKILYSDYVKNEIKKIHNIKNRLTEEMQKNLIILNKINSLQNKLCIPINYSENNIILSKISLCSVDVYSGSPIANLLQYINYPNDSNYKNYIDIFKSFSYFKSIYFKIIYTLMCYNKYYNIIHNDLHMNNILLHNITPSKIKISKHYQLYNLNDEEYSEGMNLNNYNNKIFLIPYKYYIPYIIDFSRSFIHISDNVDKNKITNNLIEHYKTSMIHTIKTELPNFYNIHKLYILFCIHEAFNKFYKIYSAFDIYKSSKGLIFILEQSLKNTSFDKHYIENNHITFMKSINVYAINFMKKYLLLLYDNFDTKIPDIRNDIIVKFYSKYNLNKFKISKNKKILKDYYSLSKKIEKTTNFDINNVIFNEKKVKELGIYNNFNSYFTNINEYSDYLKNCNYKEKNTKLKKDYI